jgi:capsular polysaccharide biosynthesis protein
MSTNSTNLSSDPRRIQFLDSQECHYSYHNIFNCPEGRLIEYNKKFTIPDQFYDVSDNAFLIPHNGHLIGFDESGSLIYDSWPHKYSIDKKELEEIQNRVSKIRVVDAPSDVFICSLIGGKGSYYHFFLDVLPRIFAAQDYSKKTGKKITFVCDDNLSPWMAQALYLMGAVNYQMLPYNAVLGEFAIRCKTLISRRGHRCNDWGGDVPYDALSPLDVKKLQEKLFVAIQNYNFSALPKKILISRDDSSSRRLLNQFAIDQEIGSSYQTIALSSMGLIDQMALFNNATHIIAVHGAGLTNLIYTKSAAVLEIHSNGHSIRPDFFQISAMNQLEYYFDVCDPLTPQDDVAVSMETIRTFLELSSK